MGRWKHNKHWRQKIAAIVLVLVLFSLVGIIASRSPLMSYAIHPTDVTPTDTSTVVTSPTDNPAPSPTPTNMPVPPPPSPTPTNTPTPVPTTIIIYPTPTAIIIYPPSPGTNPTPTPQPTAQPTPTPTGNKTPTPTPTAGAGGGAIPPGGGGGGSPQPTPGPGTPTPTPGSGLSPTPGSGAGAAVPTETTNSTPASSGGLDTTQTQHGSTLTSSMFKIGAGVGAGLLFAAAAVGIVMWKRQTAKNIQLVKAVIPPPTYGMQGPPVWTNRSEVEATFRAPVNAPPDAYAYNNQPAFAQPAPAFAGAPFNGYAQEAPPQHYGQSYQQEMPAPPPVPPTESQAGQGSRLLSQARNAQGSASSNTSSHTPPYDDASFDTPEPEGVEGPTPQEILSDPFIAAMMRQAQVGIFTMPGKPM